MGSKQFGVDTKVLWRDRKRIFGMPISFTKYFLVEKEGSWVKLFSSVGLFSTHGEEINIYRIFDVSVYQSLFDKMFGVGTLTLHCNANSTDQIYLSKVKNPYAVRAMLAEMIEIERAKKGYRITEFTS